MYPTVKAHVFQFLRASFKASIWLSCGMSSEATVAPSSRILRTASSLSRSLNLLVLAGKSGSMKLAMIAQAALIDPSMMNLRAVSTFFVDLE